ncbi:hypothetical protein HYH03_014804 [Edaphochlamys debaryana]|uniref:Smr domain-containing protein n=1 Tax=Edaphochlamys debaryana TaxID=47281 RepID=A0A835XNB1_9CHLO|nr:hypothetical protein HYH03_014804 [Edaphochlamys debaryana]|eukprot:KAG2486502.1 hypothetical protein HYH03_014804 [Edaphochlamys debaryana]
MGNLASAPAGRVLDPDRVTGDPATPEYWRAKGDAHAHQRNEAFAASKAAYDARDHARAGELSCRGKQHAEQSKAAHARAAQLLLARNNARSGPGQLDLHGLRVGEAVEAVERALEAARRDGGPQRLVLIVGKGLHSPDGQSKLRPAIEGLVRRQGVHVRAGVPNAGCITVELLPPGQNGWVEWVLGACVIC